MSDVNGHVDLELQDLLDDRLAEPRRTAVAQHAAACARCRAELEALKGARDAMRGLPNESAPADVRARVIAGLDAIDKGARREQAATRHRPRAARKVAGALILAAAAVALFFVKRPPPSAELPLTPSEIAADFSAYATGGLALDVRTTEPAAVEAYFRQRGIGFPTRVFDLGMMGYSVVGGTVRGAQARARALFVYRGSDGSELACQMYVGRVSQLPPATEVRQHNGIEFHIYRAGSVTLVYWQEGDVICVLASDARPESVIDLAMAKAVKV